MPTFYDHLGNLQTEDNRNIDEKFRWYDHNDIVAELENTKSDMVAIFSNVKGDFNLSSGIRNALWYNIRGVWVCGNKRWDSRGAVGAHHYIPPKHADTFEEVITGLREDGYRIVAAEIDDRAIPLPEYKWEKKTAVIFGEEQAGLSEDVLSMVDDIVFIPGNGSVRSLNVSVTSGTFMYAYASSLPAM